MHRQTLFNSHLPLISGDQFFITESTTIEYDDGLESFEDVVNAVVTGLPVEAEGEFYFEIDTGHRLLKDVEFEVEFEDFEEYVTSVNISENTFTLTSGKIVKVTENTIIDNEGDFLTLEAVAEALENGTSVEAEGEIYFDSSGSIWIAVEVEFEN